MASLSCAGVFVENTLLVVCEEYIKLFEDKTTRIHGYTENHDDITIV